MSDNSLRLKAAARAAELQVKLEQFEGGLNSAIARKQQELDKFKIERNLAVAKARLIAVSEQSVESDEFSDMLSELPLDTGRTENFVQAGPKVSITVPTPSMLNPNAQAFNSQTLGGAQSAATPTVDQTSKVTSTVADQNSSIHVTTANPTYEIPKSESTEENDMKQTMTNLMEYLLVSRLPPPEPGVFSGDPLQYASWKSAFETLIEKKRIDPSEKIHYLKRYLGGRARECVEGYFLLSSDEAYIEAKQKLEKRFGDPFVLGRAFSNKLENWQNISSRDGVGFLISV